MSESMTRAEYRQHLEEAYLLVKLAAVLPLDEMLAAASLAESTAPILDPTLYREKGKALREDMAVLCALKRAADIWKRVEGKEPSP